MYYTLLDKNNWAKTQFFILIFDILFVLLNNKYDLCSKLKICFYLPIRKF